MDYTYRAPPIPSAFIWRRAHSLTGLWLVLFLIEHLLTNSQAALFIGDDGNGFVRGVNFLRNLPYLPVLEIVLLGIPLFIHGVWGVRYLWTSKFNSFASDDTKPALGQYVRNRAYTWQRITSWILLFGIIAHVVHMRFVEYPTVAPTADGRVYMVRVNADDGLYTLSARLGVHLFDSSQIQTLNQNSSYLPAANPENTIAARLKEQEHQQQHEWLTALSSIPLQEHQLIAVAPSFGTAELLMVRDAFKNPITILLYTGLVLAACFHGFNGLWTFMISWGITLTARSQKVMQQIAVTTMVLVAFLGLAAIWGTYWINLTH